MSNNFQRLKDEADIALVVQHLQIPVTQRGNSYFIPCPNPNHIDEHATNCYYKDGWNNVYCCACGTSIQAIDLIMNTLGYSYGEAADYLWEIEGRPEWYYEEKRTKTKEVFSLTREEADLLGLHLTGKAICPKSVNVSKEKLEIGEEYYPKEVDEYLKCNIYRFRWNDFMSEKQYYQLVYNKCCEKYLYLQESLKKVQAMDKAFRAIGVNDKNLLLFTEVYQYQMRLCQKLFRKIKQAKKQASAR